ncbi:ROK family protein [Paenactinomyces guangxiensis]|uniref:ROK family protein n=1 Tax=Paenactinomyces guangxiensis TaxID=1490290 RepID=A0A7W1WR49_9BACL|nr:ROK family protein [Paenactinomyces guangxiensis]MBA4494351.1 ROK family protein [Paenactinomyces guangxiensis]MBH8591594.1 ROK family protein [Paenactinomyces guangxiensis]
MRKTGNLKFIQELNRSIIFDTIRELGPISRIEIAKKTGVSPTTVTSAVSELIAEGLVIEVGMGQSSGGRKPILLKFDPNGRFLIGVCITHTYISMAEMNLEAEVRRKRLISFSGKTGRDLIEYILDSIQLFMDGCHDLRNCLGISLIVPGIVDSDQGRIVYNSKLKLQNIPFKKMVEQRFDLKAYLDNDTNSIAMAEKLFGSFKQYKNLIYIMIGDGIGAGIIINDSIYRGHRGGAGEFGHTITDRGGARCECGNSGCLENYASWHAIYSRILTAIGRGNSTLMLELAKGDLLQITPKIFNYALKQGDTLALDIIEEIAIHLSIGICNIINLMDPEVVILGGELVEQNPLLLEMINQQISQKAMNAKKSKAMVYPASLGEDFGLVGAASVLLQAHFNSRLST